MINNLGDGRIEIKLVLLGYVKHGPLDKIREEVTNMLENEVETVEEIDVEDGKTSRLVSGTVLY